MKTSAVYYIIARKSPKFTNLWLMTSPFLNVTPAFSCVFPTISIAAEKIKFFGNKHASLIFWHAHYDKLYEKVQNLLSIMLTSSNANLTQSINRTLEQKHGQVISSNTVVCGLVFQNLTIHRSKWSIATRLSQYELASQWSTLSRA